MGEEAFDWSSTWRGGVLPRRGGIRVDGPGPKKEPLASLLARRGSRVRTVLERPGQERDVVEEGLRAVAVVTLSHRTLAAQQDGAQTPFGVAVAILAGLAAIPWADRDELDGVADLLVDNYGPAFAARTVAELGGLCVAGAVGQGPIVRRRSDDDPPAGLPPSWDGFAARVRRHLGAVPDDVHRQVVEELAGYRDGVLLQRGAVSFLVPDQTAWVAADVAAAAPQPASGEGWLLLHAVHTVEQAQAFVGALPSYLLGHTDVVPTLIDGVGPPIAPVLDGRIDVADEPVAPRRLLEALARLNGDEAYAALMARSADRTARARLREASRRFPERAVRMLADAPAADRRLDMLLRETVLTEPEAVERVLSTVPGPAAERVRRLRDGAAVVEAKPEALPPLLVSPPWTETVGLSPREATETVGLSPREATETVSLSPREATEVRKRPRPAVVTGLVAAPAADMVWRSGERDEWLAHRDRLPRVLDRDLSWADGVRLYKRSRLPQRQEAILVAWGPDELVRPLLATWRGSWIPDPDEWLRIAVARFGFDVLPYVRRRAEESPAAEGRYLLPYATSDLAVLMAGWYARLRSGRAPAAQWLDRHAALAARTLVPPALGKAGPARREAETALRMLAGRAHDVTIREAAAGYGPAAADGIAALLDTDPLDVLPAKPPALPAWLDVRLLPAVPLRDDPAVLPAESVRHICTMLAMSRLDAPYAGVDVVKSACDPAALAELGWALFERWMEAEAPSGDNWAFLALGLIGDDETVRRLSPQIRAWPGEGGHARAVTGLDVLRAIGTDVALMHLYGISEKVRYKGLRDKAKERIAEIATDLGLSPAELADRLVPDFGLDDDGSMVLDYGPRRFTVGFDEQLKPYVVDAAGTRRTALAKPGVADDAELAAAAAKRFAALKKDVRTAAADQLRRLEQAMTAGRRWSAPDFRLYLAGHPLLRHIVRRLVWSTDDGAAFRVAEDGSYADVADARWSLPDGAAVRVVHPVDLGSAVRAWAEVFADYEILQPFPQLARETFALTDGERAAERLVRWKDRVVPTVKLLGLERRGWRRPEPEDGGMQQWFERPLPGPDRNRLLVVIDPGVIAGAAVDVPDQRVDDVFIVREHENPWLPEKTPPLGTLDAVTASELIRDLEEVAR